MEIEVVRHANGKFRFVVDAHLSHSQYPHLPCGNSICSTGFPVSIWILRIKFGTSSRAK
jgi:hypothetical protein